MKDTHTKDKYPQKGTFTMHKHKYVCKHALMWTVCWLTNKVQLHTDSKMCTLTKTGTHTFSWELCYIFINAVLYGWLTSLYLASNHFPKNREELYSALCERQTLTSWNFVCNSGKICLCWHWSRNYSQTSSSAWAYGVQVFGYRTLKATEM